MPSNLDVTSLFRVDGLVVVITGGGTGIGLTMARALALNGARKVYLLGRRESILSTAAKEFPSVFVPVPCDVTSHASLQSAVDLVASDAGGYINLLIANSGVTGPTLPYGVPRPTTIAGIREVLFTEGVMAGMTSTLDVNVTGAFNTMIAFLPLLEAGNRRAIEFQRAPEGHGQSVVWGRPLKEGSDVPAVQSQVVFTSSISGFSRSPMSSPSYAASKAAITHLTKHSASSLARFGIRVNALAPGLFPTELAETLIGDRDPSQESPDDSRFIPARRFGTDEEMAGTILYLAGRAGAYCNGAIMLIDGGRVAAMPSSY